MLLWRHTLTGNSVYYFPKWKYVSCKLAVGYKFHARRQGSYKVIVGTIGNISDVLNNCSDLYLQTQNWDTFMLNTTFTKLQIYKLAVNIIGSYKTLLICIISNECMQSSTTYQREIELFRFPYKKISTGGHETNNDNKL